MQQYSQIVIDNLPLMLNQESKAKASVKIASYMNSMLRNAKNEQDLKIFSQTLSKCKEFSERNNLGGLNRTCTEWNYEGINKLNQIRGINEQRKQNVDLSVDQKLQECLIKTNTEINKVGMIDPDNFQAISSQLDQIEALLLSNCDKSLSEEQVQDFIAEINNQRNQIKIKYADRKSTRLNSSHSRKSRMPSSA